MQIYRRFNFTKKNTTKNVFINCKIEVKFLRYFAFLLFYLNSVVNAQTFTNSTGGVITDNNIETCFPITVSGIGNITATNGIVAVCINITHPFDGDLDIYLQAPDGTRINLSTDNGGNGNNYTNTCFTTSAITNITSTNATPPFTGSYSAEGNITTVNNGQNADGIWSICITDDFIGDIGTLDSFTLTFGILSPTVQDCPAAISICQNVYSQAIAYGGTGNIPSEIDTAISCLKDGEIADVWYTFTVQNSGFLNFIITPNTITEDYDWAVYNLTNATCADIKTGLIIIIFLNSLFVRSK